MKPGILYITLLSSIMLTANLSCTPVPPPPKPKKVVVVRTKPPRPGAVWVKGHWKWNRRLRKYVWVKGHWRTKKGRKKVIIVEK